MLPWRWNVELWSRSQGTVGTSNGQWALPSWWSRPSCPPMSVDTLGTNCDQCRCMVQCCFTSTETVKPRMAFSTFTQLLNSCLYRRAKLCSVSHIAGSGLVRTTLNNRAQPNQISVRPTSRCSPFKCCSSVILQLDKGDYPENSHVVFCPKIAFFWTFYVFGSSQRSSSSSSSSSSSNWILMSCQPHRVTPGQSNSGHKEMHNWILTSCQPHRVTSGQSNSGHKDNWILTFCQPHRVTSGQSNSGHKDNWILTSCQPHRVTSGQSNSGHNDNWILTSYQLQRVISGRSSSPKSAHISKLFS